MTDTAEIAAKLAPIQIGIRRDLAVTRQRIGGNASYVVHDPLTFQNHVFSVVEYRVLTAIVAQRSLGSTFEELVAAEVLEESDQHTFYDFVLSLHDLQLLQLPIMQAEKLFQRWQRKREMARAHWYKAVLYLKLPMLDPDRFLTRTLPYVGWLFSKVGIALWALLMGCVLWKCAGSFGTMLDESLDLLQIGNLPILWIALVGLKVVHEFGHAYACKSLGGNVPEMGAVFIVMTPCAYVDASSSWKFPDRSQRVAVALGGMYVESLVAGIAALVWVATPSGLMHDFALNIVILAGVVTVLMNLNPLMKFDGYFVFSDLCGVVNLQSRSSRILKGWMKWLGLGMPRPTVDESRGTRWLYALYGPSAVVYKISLAFGITMLVMMQWPGAGLLLGVMFGCMMIVQPVVVLFKYLLTSDETAEVRSRARWIAGGGFAGAVTLLAFLPVSWNVVVPGTLDPGVRRSVRAPVSGFVTKMHAEDGQHVAAGSLLVELESPSVERMQVETLGAMQAEETRFDVHELDDPTLASAHLAQIEHLRERQAELQRRADAMQIDTDTAGTVVTATSRELVGRFVRQGEEILQVHSEHSYLRVVLTDEEVLRARLEVGTKADVRWSCEPNRTVRGVVREIRRSASRSHVPVELTMQGGGDVYVQDAQSRGAQADQPYLHVFLDVEELPAEVAMSGMTARVRLGARIETLGGWMRDRMLRFFRGWMMS